MTARKDGTRGADGIGAASSGQQPAASSRPPAAGALPGPEGCDAETASQAWAPAIAAMMQSLTFE